MKRTGLIIFFGSFLFLSSPAAIAEECKDEVAESSTPETGGEEVRRNPDSVGYRTDNSGSRGFEEPFTGGSGFSAGDFGGGGGGNAGSEP